MEMNARAIVSESLESKRTEMAFHWLMAFLRECYDPITFKDMSGEGFLESLVMDDLGLEDGALAWTVDPVTKIESLIVGLGENKHVIYSMQQFHRQTQMIIAAPTAMQAKCQRDYWSGFLVDVYGIYRYNMQQAA